MVKLLVFAHTPPPHHGQSYMVQLLLDALGGDVRGPAPAGVRGRAAGIECHHVNARFSDSLTDVGRARWGKLFLAFKYCAQAIWRRFRAGADCFYYVPAHPSRTPIYRDWLVLALCRPFFRRTIFHWHATGLGEWLAEEARPWERWVSRRVYAHADLSIVLRRFNRRDGEALDSRRIEIVPNGIPDPCPEFERDILPRRLARLADRQALLAGQATTNPAAGVFNLLYVGLCYREKGLFDAVEAIALVRQQLVNSPVRVRLLVAGTFWVEAEKAEFEERIRRADLQDSRGPLVEYRGFVGGAEKKQLFIEADALCFPTYYRAESFGLVLVEGMAFGLPPIVTRWRDIPELLPPEAPGIVDPKSPEQIAAATLLLLARPYDATLRAWFLKHYTEVEFARHMTQVLASVCAASPPSSKS